ncbi:hypothetical protein Dimus_038293 [Dionaea muscipula]
MLVVCFYVGLHEPFLIYILSCYCYMVNLLFFHHCCIHGDEVYRQHCEDVCKVWRDEVNKTKVQPNEITFVSSLQACSLMGAQELGESMQDYATKASHLPNSFLVSAIIDMYCKFGRIKHGKALFDQSPIRDLIC